MQSLKSFANEKVKAEGF